MSFRIKTIIGIVLIESFLLIILIISVMSFLRTSNENQLQQHALTTSTLFTHTVKDAVLSTDIATLDSLIENIIHDRDIIYVRITSNGHLLAEGGPADVLNATHHIDTKLDFIDDGIFDIRTEIIEAGTVYGVIEIGISTTIIQSSLVRAQRWAIFIAILEVLLVALLSFILGTYLTKQLQQLKKASEQISQSGAGTQIKISGHDEITDVVNAFNHMSSTLANNYSELSRSIEQEKKMTRVANSNQAKHEAILNASLDALITINAEGKVIDYNQIASETFGWEFHEIVGQNLAEFIIPPAFRDAHHHGMDKYLKTKIGPVLNKRIELTALHKTGYTFPIEINIAPIETENDTLFTAFIRDISERLQTESELRVAAQTFESGEPIFICDPEGTILRINQAFTEVTGYEEAEVIGQNPRILSSDQHPPEYYKNLWASLIEHGQWKGEIYNKRKNGEVYPEYINISAVKDGKHKITHYIAHFMDISEQKENERKLRKAQHQAEISNKAKSNFLASMSHEIRTPMNAVLGILELLQHTKLTNQQIQLVQTGCDSGELLLSIINDILDFTKMEIDKLKLESNAFDLHQLIAGCNELLQTMAHEKHITLQSQLSEDLPRFVMGDATRLRQILINLINNAIKFTSEGRVEVIATVDSIDDKILIMRCRIKDTGIGIEETNLSSLFDEFTMVDQTHSRQYEGTGLGLAICKRLVTLMGGKIQVSSTIGQGSTFEFTVQLAIANDMQLQQQPTKPQQLPSSSTRILLAEDNRANQMVISSILEFANLKIDVVDNGFKAVEAVQQQHYDIVLMDISMPGMDGMTATQTIRKLDGDVANIPIIALTAHTLNGDKERFLEAGMNDYLSKPIDRAATLSCIAHWTEKSINQMTNISEIKAAPKIDNEPPHVDEAVLQQLVQDTSPEIVPELIELYIEDSKIRMNLINEAISKHDFATLEFEAHTIGSSAIAHGNAKLHAFARKLEHLCQQNHYQQASKQAVTLIKIAEESFDLLAERANQGFIQE